LQYQVKFLSGPSTDDPVYQYIISHEKCAPSCDGFVIKCSPQKGSKERENVKGIYGVTLAKTREQQAFNTSLTYPSKIATGTKPISSHEAEVLSGAPGLIDIAESDARHSSSVKLWHARVKNSVIHAGSLFSAHVLALLRVADCAPIHSDNALTALSLRLEIARREGCESAKVAMSAVTAATVLDWLIVRSLRTATNNDRREIASSTFVFNSNAAGLLKDFAYQVPGQQDMCPEAIQRVRVSFEHDRMPQLNQRLVKNLEENLTASASQKDQHTEEYDKTTKTLCTVVIVAMLIYAFFIKALLFCKQLRKYH
ncbi:hypothetical protein Bbelb_392500, partial [Branchiostoma belcheri]